MSDAPVAPARERIRALRRRRMRLNDARTRLINLRCSERERELVKEAALRAGLSVGAFLRALALGDPGPRAVRRPPIERVELVNFWGTSVKSALISIKSPRPSIPLVLFQHCQSWSRSGTRSA